MDIDHPACVMFDKTRRQNTHETGQNQKIRLIFINRFLQNGIIGFPVGIVLVRHDPGRNTCFSGETKTCSIGTITDDCRQFRIPFFLIERPDNGFHIAAPAGNKNDDIFHDEIVPVGQALSHVCHEIKRYDYVSLTKKCPPQKRQWRALRSVHRQASR